MDEFSSEEKVCQCLEDMGCDSAFMKEFQKNFQRCDLAAQKRMLLAHRAKQMDELHASQKRIDCLDFLIYQLEKECRK